MDVGWVDISLSAPGGGEGRGEVGDSRALADTHLTRPAQARRAPSSPRRAEREVVRPLAMAGTDRSRAGASGGPAIILVEPQLGENIGTAARAMMNCGLDDLRLVRPRDGWPSDKAIAAASGADALLAKARLYPDIPAAIADL